MEADIGRNAAGLAATLSILAGTATGIAARG
jgi:hypothetical protein